MNDSSTEALAQVSAVGIQVDRMGTVKAINAINKTNDGIARDLGALVGRNVKVNSKKDMTALFNKLGIEFTEKTKAGYACLNKDALRRLKGKYPQHTDLLDSIVTGMSNLSKRGDLKNLLKFSEEDGRIHTQFTEDCSSGRFYTKAPNLNTMAAICRQHLIPDEGNEFICLDYDREEMTIMAVISGDTALLNMLQSGEDPHAATARDIGRPGERDLGKTLNYAMPYGIEPVGLVKRLGITEEEAKDIINRYFQAHPQLGACLREIAEQAFINGLTQTPISHRVCEMRRNESLKKSIRRCVNHVFQGAAADVLRLVLTNLLETGLIKHVRMSMHDALLAEVDEAGSGSVAAQIKKVMLKQNPYGLRVTVGYGPTWAKAQGLEV